MSVVTPTVDPTGNPAVVIRAADEFRRGRESYAQTRRGEGCVVPCELSAVDLGSLLADAGSGNLCTRVQRLLTGVEGEEVLCDLASVTDPDLATLAALARVSLAARRIGRTLRFCHPPPELVELAELAGLADVLLLGSRPLGVEPVGQPEQGEQPAGVEERAHGDDLPP